jgi:prephenate dehydrogenase
MKKIRMGIIGGTRGMGKWFADYFRGKGLHVEVVGKRDENDIPLLASRCNAVVVAVPITVTTETIRRAGPHMSEDSLLMDLTSLKVEPVREMLESSACEVIGLHPLFGPGVSSLRGENVFIYAARGKRWFPWLEHMLLCDGGRLVQTTPEKHDEMMAYVQVLTHLGTVVTGMVLRESAIHPADLLRFSTPAFRSGIAMMEKIFRTNPRLYGELIALNPKSHGVAEAFRRNLSRVLSFVGEQDGEGLARWIKGV